MTDTEVEPARTGSPLVLVLCAVFGLGALGAAQLNVLGQIWFLGLVESDVAVYVSLAVLVAALLAWHRWPLRSWAVLLVTGAVCAAPTSVLWLVDDVYAEWMLTPYLVVTSSALPLLLVGTLGVATASWRAGRRGAGAALFGAVLAVAPLTGLAVAGLIFGGPRLVPVVVLVVLVATAVCAVVATRAGPAPLEPAPRLGWQVTVGGAVAGVAPALTYQVWGAPGPYRPGGDAEAYYQEVGQHYLVVGLVVLGVGLVAGAVAGPRVLTTGVAAGLVMGALASLAVPAAQDLYDLPDGVLALLVVGALVVAVFVAVWTARLVVGTTGLGVLIAGLLVLWWDVRAGDPLLGADVVGVLTPVLLVVAVVAAVSTLASLGTAVATAGEAPAVFAGVTAAVTTGVSGIIAYFTASSPAGEPELAGTFPPVVVSLTVAVLLVTVVHRVWQDRSARPAVGSTVVGPR